MLQFAQGFRLNLADTFARHAELLADFFQSVVGVHPNAKAHPQNPLFARSERCKHAGHGFLKVRLDCSIHRDDSVLILDKVTKVRIFLITNRCFKADRFLGDFHHLADLFKRHREARCHLLRRGLTAFLVQELARGAHQLVDRLDHMHWNTDRASLVSDRTRDCLPDPPCRIGREFVTATIFKFINRLHKANIALLNKVEELQAAIGVFLRDRDHEAKVGFDHFTLGNACLALALLDHIHDPAELGQGHASVAGNISNLGADTVNRLSFILSKRSPFLVLLNPVAQPSIVQLVANIGIEEVDPLHLVAFCKAQHLAPKRG